MTNSNDNLREVVEAAAPQIEETVAMNRDLALDYESAVIAISELQGKQQKDLEGTTIYSGFHPTYGNIHIVMPMMGDGVLLLPFVFRDF